MIITTEHGVLISSLTLPTAPCPQLEHCCLPNASAPIPIQPMFDSRTLIIVIITSAAAELAKLVRVNLFFVLFCFPPCHLTLITTEEITGMKSQQTDLKTSDGLEMLSTDAKCALIGGGDTGEKPQIFFEAHVKKGINYPKSTPYIPVLWSQFFEWQMLWKGKGKCHLSVLMKRALPVESQRLKKELLGVTSWTAPGDGEHSFKACAAVKAHADHRKPAVSDTLPFGEEVCKPHL